MKRQLATLILFPGLAWADPFAAVTNARDAADGVAVTPAPAVSNGFAAVTDPRDTMPMAPPKAVAAALVGERTAATMAVPTPHVLPTTPSPTLPPLVKRDVPQKVTEATPGVLLVQPDNLPTKGREAPLSTNGTLSGDMFKDRTETLTPNGVIDDQPEPKDGFSFGGGESTHIGNSDIASPLSMNPTPEVSSSTLTSETAPALTPSPTIGPVKVISPVAEISPVAVTIPTTVASPTVPLTQPIAAGLSFLNDDITLSPRTKQQLETFARLAKGNMLKQITITQRTVAPLDALTTLADARRKLILDQLKTLGAINDATQVSEVRTRSTAATSKITLIGN